jgi:hypothetical protein
MRMPKWASISGTMPRSIAAARASLGLLDLDHLEAAGQGGVLLEVLLVLGPGGGGDRAQLAARQGRLEQVGGVVLAGRPPAPIRVWASSMNRMIGLRALP